MKQTGGWLERLLWKHRRPTYEDPEEVAHKRKTARRIKGKRAKLARRKNRKPKAHRPRNKRR